VAHVGAGWTDERDVGALVVGRDFERAARPGRVLLEDQRDCLADEPLFLAAFFLSGLQLGSEVEQVRDLFWAEVGELQQAPAAQVDDRAQGLSSFPDDWRETGRLCSDRRARRARRPQA
jgi:hypothetical protein